METNKPTPVVSAADHYLDALGHTQPAYEHVNHVLGAFEFAVRLATTRALEKLEVEEPEPRDAIIIPFPRRPDPAA